MPMSALACPDCSAELYADDTFCEACGKRLDGKGPDAAALAAANGASAPAHLPAPTGPRVAGIGCAFCGAPVSEGYCEGCGMAQPNARDHVELHLDLASGVSDRGRRHKKNEDSMAIVGTTGPDGAPVVAAVVCDGVSSSPHPEDASQVGADTGAAVLAREFAAGQGAARATRIALTRAAEAVAALATSPRSAPACTYVSALVGSDAGAGGDVTIGWIGDSRAYWLPSAPPEGHGAADPAPTAPVVLTVDDSWAEQMVSAGAMTAEEAQVSANAHALIAWLGGDAPELDIHVSAIAPRGPGAVIVCSDGLWNYFPEAAELAAAVPRSGADPLDAARTFVRLANEAGGHDNITAVVIPVPLRPVPEALPAPGGHAFSFEPPAAGPPAGPVQSESVPPEAGRPQNPGSPSSE